MEKQKSKLTKFGLRFWRSLPWTARRIEICIIVIAIIVVAVAIIVGVFFNSTAVTKRNIEAMAKDYYENYYYDNFVTVVKNPDEAFLKYTEAGFPAVSVGQLLLFDNRRNANLTAMMEENCDTAATTIKIFPEEPFGKNDYRIEYNYSCNF